MSRSLRNRLRRLAQARPVVQEEPDKGEELASAVGGSARAVR
jgi:hypothetical protein